MSREPNLLESPEPPVQHPKSNGLSARNIATLVLTVLFLIVDLSALVNPPATAQQRPFWYNCITFGVIGSLVILSLGYTCADKDNLFACFPQLARVKSWHLWFVTAVVLFVCTAIVSAVGAQP